VVIVTVLYLVLVYLLFFKLRWLPWNKLTQGLTLLIGVIILTAFLVGLQGLTPSSSQGQVTTRITEIAPQVSGRVISVPAERNVQVEQGSTLFTIDPTLYQARVDELEARLELSRLRLQQYGDLAAADAGSQFQLQQTEAETRQLGAQLVAAKFDLENTIVRAPSQGLVPALILTKGMQVSPSKAVLTFVDTSELYVSGLFDQKALQNVRVGDKAMINFPALPGQVFESTVVVMPGAIGNAQFMASGALTVIEGQRMTRLYPIFMELPEDFPKDLVKIGLAASTYIHTEGAGVVGIVAVILQWVSTSLDAII
jgi:multidrug resistance efflux pump